MKIKIPGKPDITLSRNDYLAQGGEGSIYTKGSKAFKIYQDSTKVIPLGKIQELAEIKNPNVIKPQELVFGNSRKPVGYSMQFIKNTTALCQLFTKAFKTRNGIDSQIILNLVKSMHDTIIDVHDSGVLIVDLNELNFLVDKSFTDIYFIDVDSYQTKSYRAPVIMPSIQDPHARIFNQNTDWYSFAIVTFQLFIGIHPFKGKYKNKMSLRERMTNNISVFNSEVTVPKVCFSFDSIPRGYLNWYKDVFEKGLRLPPPEDMHLSAPIVYAVKRILGDQSLVIDLVKEYKNAIQRVYSDNLSIVCQTTENVVGTLLYRKYKGGVLGTTPRHNQTTEFYEESGSLVALNHVTQKEVYREPMNISGLMSYNNRIYIKNGPNVLRASFLELPDKTVVTTKVAARVLENSSIMYDGVVIQDVLGTYYASVFPELESHYQLKLEELAGYKVVNARFDHRLLGVVAVKDGVYSKFLFMFRDNFTKRNLRIKEDITVHDLNFVCLDNGVCVHVNDSEKLELFHINSPDIKEISSDSVSSETALYKNGLDVLLTQDRFLYKIKTK